MSWIFGVCVKCINWNIGMQYPKINHNYCRNFGGKRDNIWCFTSINEWEYCDVQDPKFMVYYICENKPIQLLGTEILMKKENILIYSLVNDLITMFIFAGFVSCFLWIQNDFAQKFDNQCIEMRDFTLRIDKLPIEFAKHEDALSMEFAIWKLI